MRMGGGRYLLSGIRTPADPKDSFLVLFLSPEADADGGWTLPPLRDSNPCRPKGLFFGAVLGH